ncbi:unnamed protein product [Amoebophrya sp. A25]|nr:unnamed protein product [Amoebophrya sp. A25]|eukprot:GSA25T00017437001.1
MIGVLSVDALLVFFQISRTLLSSRINLKSMAHVYVTSSYIQFSSLTFYFRLIFFFSLSEPGGRNTGKESASFNIFTEDCERLLQTSRSSMRIDHRDAVLT